jgi:amino acid transporter
MADPFGTMVQNMQNMGFFQYLFPFLLSFAILYGVLKWVFDKKIEPRVVALISVVLSFFVMLYSAYNTWLYQFLADASGVWLGMGTILLFIVVLAALAGVNIHDILGGEKRNWVKYLIILVIIYVVIVSFLGSGYLPFLPYWVSGSDIWTVVLVVVILGIIFWFVGGEGKKDEAPAAAPPGGK